MASLLLTGCGGKRGTVSLALLGDINLGRGVNPSAESLAFLSPQLKKADLALANLESPLGYTLPTDPAEYNLCAPAERGTYLSAWGLDLVSIVNNHSADCGDYGALMNISAIESAGLFPIWDGASPVDRTIHGVKLAFLAFEDVTQPLDADAAVQAIQSAHGTGAVVIVSIHWGMEYQSGASERQQDLARRFAGAGAALIWGHHPHVLQPAEWIQSGARKTLVLYSLGNALFDQPGLADTRQSALISVVLNTDGVQSVRAVPFVIDVGSSRVVEPDADTARKILDQLKME